MLKPRGDADWAPLRAQPGSGSSASSMEHHGADKRGAGISVSTNKDTAQTSEEVRKVSYETPGESHTQSPNLKS